MPVVNETVANGLAAYYEYVAVQLHQWVDPLSNEQFWRKPYVYENSAGHLVLHMTGNLNYYIGARVAETGYRRRAGQPCCWCCPPQARLCRQRSCRAGTSTWDLRSWELVCSSDLSFGTASTEFTAVRIDGGMEQCPGVFDPSCVGDVRAAGVFCRGAADREGQRFDNADHRPIAGMESCVQSENVTRWEARGLRSAAGQLGRERVREKFVDRGS